MSSALVWELVKKNNCFISKNLNGTIWSKEPCNLTGVHSYKFSGIANSNKLGVSEEDGAMAISVASKKDAHKIQKTSVKKNARRCAHAAGAVARKVRPDLVKVAKAKASAVARGIRTRKALAK